MYIHTQEFEENLLSCSRDGVEDRACICCFHPLTGLPHYGRHSSSGQGLEMFVGRNVDDWPAKIHGPAHDACHDLSAHKIGFWDGSLEEVNEDFPHVGPVPCHRPFCGPRQVVRAGINREKYISVYTRYMIMIPAAALTRLAISAKPTLFSTFASSTSNRTKSNVGPRASNISLIMSSLIDFECFIPSSEINHGTTQRCTSTALYFSVNAIHGPISNSFRAFFLPLPLPLPRLSSSCSQKKVSPGQTRSIQSQQDNHTLLSTR